MADGYCLAFTGHSLGRRPYLLLFVRLHSGTYKKLFSCYVSGFPCQ